MLIIVTLQKQGAYLICAGIENSVICRGNRYFICRDEIELDTDLFEKLYRAIKLSGSRELAKHLVSLYKGEYLLDFEALWATCARIRYQEIYKEAKKYCELATTPEAISVPD